MDRVDEILFLYEDDRVEMQNGGLSKKERIAQGLEKGRVSKKLTDYFDAVIVYNGFVSQARAERDATILPKSLKSFLESRGLKEGTYGNLKNKLPELELPAKARITLANDIIRNYNSQLKFKELNKILKDAKFTDKEIKALQVSNLDKADKAKDKARKAYDFLFKNNENSVSTVFNPRSKISELTGLTGETISKKFNVKEYDPDGFKMYENLSNPQVKKSLQARIDRGANINIKNYFKEVENVKKGLPPTAAKLAAETRKGRLKIAAKKAGEGVTDINKAQDEVVSLLNKFYKENPQELLGNTKLRNLLDLTLKDGEIVKKNKYVTDDDFLKLIKDKKGLFTIDHVDEVQFEKLSTEFPIFKQLATYNTNSGLIKSIKSYVSKNQNSTDPVVQDKIKKQIEFLEDLKLRVDTPMGRIGSKEVLAAIDRKAGVLPNFLAQLRALDIKLPGKAKAALLGIGGGLGLNTFVSAGPIEETGTKSILPEVAGGAAAGSLAFKPVRQAVGKGLKATGRALSKFAVPIGIGAEAYFAKQAYDEGKTIPEIMAAPFLLEGKVRKAQDLLSMSPEERQAVNRASREDDISGLSSDFDTPRLEGVDEVDIEEVLKRVQRKRMADEARRREERKAGGGIAGIRKPDAIPPESGPNPQGLENLKYYVTNT